MSKHKAHQQYRTESGKIVPGVTTVTKELGWNTQALKYWAYNCGRRGIDIDDYSGDKMKIGTLAHKLIEQHLLELMGEDLDLTEFKKDFTENQIDQADNSFLSYLEWEKSHEVEPIYIEEQMVSEKYGYGGTPDFYGKVDSEYEVMDFKTGSGIYDDYIIQLSAYAYLFEERLITANLHEKSHGVLPDEQIQQLRIFRIPRTEDETFQEKILTEWDNAFQIFLNCLDTYNRKKKIK